MKSWMLLVGCGAMVIFAACGSTQNPLSPGNDHDNNDAVDAAFSSSGEGGIFATGGDASMPGCVNLQCKQVNCKGQGRPETTVSGIVYDPAGKNPLYDIVVYVPNAPVAPFTAGPSCDRCGAEVSGSPVAATLTGPDGRFVLKHVPAGQNIPLVLQIGKWRKQVVIPSVTACSDTPMVDAKVMRLPAKQSEGDMPQIALVAGACDYFECLLRRIGVDDSEFTNEQGKGKVHIYLGGPTPGADISSPTSPGTKLWSSPALLANYDVVINACGCSEDEGDIQQPQVDNLVAYANQGGRVFNTHYSYFFIDPQACRTGNCGPPSIPVPDNLAWKDTANFRASGGAGGLTNPWPPPGVSVDMSFPKGDAFATWLVNVGASTTKGVLPLPLSGAMYFSRVSTLAPASTRWLYSDGISPSSTPVPVVHHYTFDTPVGAPSDKQCGKVLYTAFHVVDGPGTKPPPFPTECAPTPMTVPDKALEFMLFDLTSCVQVNTAPPAPPPVK
jgi:hypothetical protein